MKINKNLIILSLLLIFCISLGVVSAADSTDIGVNDINNNIDVNSADVQTSGASFNEDINNLRLDEYKTFKDGVRIMRYTKYAFDEDIIKGIHIFKIKDENNIDEIEMVIKEKMKNIFFILIL